MYTYHFHHVYHLQFKNMLPWYPPNSYRDLVWKLRAKFLKKVISNFLFYISSLFFCFTQLVHGRLRTLQHTDKRFAAILWSWSCSLHKVHQLWSVCRSIRGAREGNCCDRSGVFMTFLLEKLDHSHTISASFLLFLSRSWWNPEHTDMCSSIVLTCNYLNGTTEWVKRRISIKSKRRLPFQLGGH